MSLLVEVIRSDPPRKCRVQCACGRIYVTSQDAWHVKRARYCMACVPNPRHMQLNAARAAVRGSAG